MRLQASGFRLHAWAYLLWHENATWQRDTPSLRWLDDQRTKARLRLSLGAARSPCYIVYRKKKGFLYSNCICSSLSFCLCAVCVRSESILPGLVIYVERTSLSVIFAIDMCTYMD